MSASRNRRVAALFGVLTLAFSTVAMDHAEARRGGSFGSRGARTYQSAPATNTAPSVAPVQRSITSPSQATPAAGAAAAGTGARSGLFGGGFGGAMLRGLAIGGLFGLLMGQGFGGLAGMLGLLVQVALVVGVVMLAMRFFRRRREGQQPAMAGGRPEAGNGRSMFEGLGAGRDAPAAQGSGARGYAGAAAPVAASAVGQDQIGVTQADLGIFESRLQTLQASFSREDYAGLREITTPEIMSYLSQELAENASRGVRVEAGDVSLLQGDVAESWKEGSRDYATVAMRYSMIEVTRDRETGAIMEGDEARPVESTEIWTFIRDFKDEWKLSAIQTA